MSNSINFKAAHAMTKQVIKAGDNYQVTFGACLKIVIADAKKAKIEMLKAPYKALENKGYPVSFLVLVIIALSLVKLINKISFKIDWVLVGGILLASGLFITGYAGIAKMDERNKASFAALYADAQ